jgi:tRNA1(Val) A37 N6-methylase TrmN6
MTPEIFEINGLKLCVNKEHRFGTDAVKLAEFAAGADGSVRPKKPQVICDLCTGCGIIPFLIIGTSSVRPHKIFALDINEDAIGLLRQSIKINSLSELIFPIHEDLKCITQIPAESIDTVTMNPPYYKADDGFKRSSGGSARHELLCDLDDAVKAAAKLLKYGGRLKMCHIPERLADVVCTLRKYNLEPKVIKFLANKKDEPWLMLIDAKKGGKPGLKIQFSIDN